MSAPRTRARDPQEYVERKAARRRSVAMHTLSTVPAEIDLDVPAPVTEIVRRYKGVTPKLPAEAFELARQVYYLQHGTMADCARAIIAQDLGDSTDETIVRERLQTWWKRERWPKRPTGQTIALRDATADGGLHRGSRLCKGLATGNGAAPEGSPCGQNALADSDYCPRHDPRPAYEEMRERTGRRLAAARAAEFVSIEPFRNWLNVLRDHLVAEEEAAGRRLHRNSEGWHLVAEKLDLDVSQLGRWAVGGKKRGKEITRIRAKTVVQYVGRLDVSFEEIYGFDAPAVGGVYICPSCGGRKNAESKLCRTCFEAETYGSQCTYVNGKGERCPVTTRHESGQCAQCRRITQRVRRSRTGRTSFVTVPMLILAAEEYVAGISSLSWVAACMWEVNAGGVRDVFKSRKSLTGSLVKRFRKLGWRSIDAVRDGRAALVAEHGEIPWPARRGAAPLEAAGMLPFDPFRRWLVDRHAELGSYSKLSDRIRMNPDNLSRWIRGEAKDTIRRSTVEAALEQWGEGVKFADIYGGGS